MLIYILNLTYALLAGFSSIIASLLSVSSTSYMMSVLSPLPSVSSTTLSIGLVLWKELRKISLLFSGVSQLLSSRSVVVSEVENII